MGAVVVVMGVVGVVVGVVGVVMGVVGVVTVDRMVRVAGMARVAEVVGGTRAGSRVRVAISAWVLRRKWFGSGGGRYSRCQFWLRKW